MGREAGGDRWGRGWAAARVVQAACYIAAPAALYLGATAAARLGTTPGEVLIGVLAASGLAVGLAGLGTSTALAGEIRRR